MSLANIKASRKRLEDILNSYRAGKEGCFEPRVCKLTEEEQKQSRSELEEISGYTHDLLEGGSISDETKTTLQAIEEFMDKECWSNNNNNGTILEIIHFQVEDCIDGYKSDNIEPGDGNQGFEFEQQAQEYCKDRCEELKEIVQEKFERLFSRIDSLPDDK